VSLNLWPKNRALKEYTWCEKNLRPYCTWIVGGTKFGCMLHGNSRSGQRNEQKLSALTRNFLLYVTCFLLTEYDSLQNILPQQFEYPSDQKSAPFTSNSFRL
jgi:hypothetical protein